MKTPSLVLLLLGLAISTAQAQVSQEWVARYASATPYNDVPYAMTVDAAGHVYVTGTTATSTGGHDWATIKYNSAGVQEWLRTLDGGGSDAAFAIKTDQAGNVYVTGSSAGGLYFMTAKYNAAGDRLWVQTFTTIGEGDAGVDLALDHEGNVYVTGYNVETSIDIITIKYSPGGAELWVRRYDSGSGEDVPAAIACDASGIYVTGRSGGSFTTIKYDFNGVQQWVRNYNAGHGSDSAADLIVDAAGNIYVTGQSTGAGTNADYATIKYDAAGTQQWVRRYDGPTSVFASDYDRAVALAVDADGNVFVTGNSSDDFATVKYDAAGTEIWVRRYNGPAAGGDWATAIAVDASGNAYVSGSSYGNSTTQYDFATLSYDPSGAVRWTERYNGPGNFYDTPYSIAVHSGNVYVSGSSGGIGTGLDYTTIKYAPGTPPSPPTIASFTPASGPAGTVVTITGSNFMGVSGVTFNLTPASHTVISGTQIQATVPAGASTGRIRVTTAGGTATSGSDFTVTTPPQPTTLTFISPHDAWVRLSSPSSNFGARPELRVRGGSQTTRSYLKFNVSGVSGPVQSATLRLRVIDAGPDGGSVFSVSNNLAATSTPWTESALNWNNAPAPSGSALDAAGPVVANTWLELDVTTAVTGNGTYSFAVSGGSNNVVDYSSSEGANPPQLVVVMGSGSAATPVAMAEAAPALAAPPVTLELRANTPNPFNPRTTIRYSLPRVTLVRIVIYDVNGRLVRRLVDGIEPAGERAATWDGRDDRGAFVGSGVYVYALEADGTRFTRKMSLLK
jgi:FlgD Ig-like domain/IPT/TIG domain/Beta-propeller repeat